MKDTRELIEHDDRVLRGGCWVVDTWGCRLAFRGADRSGRRAMSLGFRVILRGRISNERHNKVD